MTDSIVDRPQRPKDMCKHDYRLASIVHGIPQYKCTGCDDGYQVLYLTEFEQSLVDND